MGQVHRGYKSPTSLEDPGAELNHWKIHLQGERVAPSDASE